ncbi:MAG: AAA family ATPase, partial [Phenylobacterium sp.]
MDADIAITDQLIREAGIQQFAARYLEKRGWFESLRGMPQNKDGAVPWITYPAFLQLRRIVKPDFKVFEYGCGGSSVWWAEHVAEVTSVEHVRKWADQIAATNLPNLSIVSKQLVLEQISVRKRMEYLNTELAKELEVLELRSKIQNQVQEEVGKSQREYFLREQLRAIQRELGETDDGQRETEELRKLVEASGMPEEARKEADRELGRLARMNPSAAEYTVSRTYLDWLVALPWNGLTTEKIDIVRAREILHRDHYDLEKIKERILEYLAVLELKPEGKAPILCFVGPPGVGKTSLGRSIAEAMGRKFVRVSLGGMRDEAEIRGHRRTYIGALPGQMIQNIRRAGTRDPVFMLD